MESHLQSLIAFFSAHPQLALGAIFAASLLEALAVIGTVIPGSSIVFVGGVLIGLKALDPWSAVVAAVIGAILGDSSSYWLGQRYHDRIRAIWPMKTYPGLFDRGQAYFAKNGGKSVFLGRFLGPLRAIVPVVAGMSNMPAGQFYLMNILSAVAWAAAHILPGMLFGTSLQLAGAVSSRLVVLLVATVIVLWAMTKLVRFALTHGWPRLITLRDRTVEFARGKSGPFARVVLSLFDPARAESAALLTAAVLLIGSAWLFLGILEDVVSGDRLVQFDRTVYSVLQGLRTAWVDNVMVAITEMGGVAGTLPVVVVVSSWLSFKRYWRTLGYWLAAAGFAEILVSVLKYLLRRTRPNNIYTGIEQFSFPSGHTTLSIVVYGFMAFLLARAQPVGTKIAVILVAAVAILLIAFSRVYLGVHWFSDVLGSLALGVAWIALLSIAYTHHVQTEKLSVFPLLLMVSATLALVAAVYVRGHRSADLERYAYRPKVETILLADWNAGGWRSLSLARSELDGEYEEPFSVQWIGTAARISETLAVSGWHVPPTWTLKTASLWMLAKTPIAELPVLPKFDHGEAQTLTFVRVLNLRERFAVRLWVVGEVIDTDAGRKSRPLWHGMVTIERLDHPVRKIMLVTTASDFVTPLERLERDLRNQHLSVVKQKVRGISVLRIW
ncbi:MAG: phosphatase PAP2 family protein [Gammaproteobacteria bacterium]|nr:phosphatase PAP2 family protein [Gammaproteobacteria bacterium]